MPVNRVTGDDVWLGRQLLILRTPASDDDDSAALRRPRIVQRVGPQS